MPIRFACLVAILTLGAVGCASPGPKGSAPPPFVITSGEKLYDLYAWGELTDDLGNRWNIWIIPGVAASAKSGLNESKSAYDFAMELSEANFWVSRGEDFEDGLRFASQKCLRDFMKDGIAEDYSSTHSNISANVKETPFGWIPRILVEAILGYLVKPAFRLVFGTAGVAAGGAYSLLAPTAQVLGRPVGGLVRFVVAGLAWPVVRMAIHQPIYLLSIVNREPAREADGSFGMSIIKGSKDPDKILLPNRSSKPQGGDSKQNGAGNTANRKVYGTNSEDYKIGFRAGLKEGLRRARVEHEARERTRAWNRREEAKARKALENGPKAETEAKEPAAPIAPKDDPDPKGGVAPKPPEPKNPITNPGRE